VLVEVAETVREGLLDELDRQDLVAALGRLDADDLAYLEGAVPTDVWQDVSRALYAGELTFLRTSMAYQEHTIGHLMSGDIPAIREAPTLGDLLADLRRRAEPLPEHTDRILVVDARNVLRGAISTSELLRRDPATATPEVLDTELAVFATEDPLDDAVKVFERYDLVSAPVVDDRGKLVGRLTVDVVMDYVRQQADRTTLKRAGLSSEEDLFAPVADSARNR
jgi:magnesium transporter